MKQEEYNLLLLKVAICAMGSDGVIDDREIEMLYKIEKESNYFKDIELSNILNDELEKFKKKSSDYIDSTFNSIKNTHCIVPQELCMLEVAILIIKADGVEEDAEKIFIQKLRSYLKVDNFVIQQRFSGIDYLGNSDHVKFSDSNKNISEGTI
tara:strand:- start:51 stop:509 length:459 start_codon:yes stop_codon:yes gene_type:complete